jgi:hypothetical protein
VRSMSKLVAGPGVSFNVEGPLVSLVKVLRSEVICA